MLSPNEDEDQMPSWYSSDEPVSFEEALAGEESDPKQFGLIGSGDPVSFEEALASEKPASKQSPKQSAFDGLIGSGDPVSFEEALASEKPEKEHNRPEARSGEAIWNSVVRASEATASGLASARVGIGRLPSSIGLEVMSHTNPDRYDEIKADPKKFAAYQDSFEGIPGIGAVNIDSVNDRLYNEFIKGSEERVEEHPRSKAAEGGDEQKPWYRNPDWWLESGTETGTQLAGQVSVGVLTGGASALALAGTTAGGQQYETAKERGVGELGAVFEGSVMGVLEAAMEKSPFGKILAKPGAKQALYRGAMDFVTKNAPRFVGAGAGEALEEGSTEVADIAFRLIEGDEKLRSGDKAAWQQAGTQVLQSAALGGVAGAGLGVPGTVGDYQRGKRKPEAEAARKGSQEQRLRGWIAQADQDLEFITAGPDGSKRLEELSKKDSISRKEFEDAGFNPAIRFNEQERLEYIKGVANRGLKTKEELAEDDRLNSPPPSTPPAQPETTEAPPDVDTKMIEEAVDETVKITNGQGVGNEDKMFGPRGYFAQGVDKAKKKLGETSGTALTPEAKNLISGVGESKAVKGIKSAVGSAFDKFVNPKGSRKIVDRAVDDVQKFMDKEGGERFKEYYHQQLVEEANILKQRFPEIDISTPEGVKFMEFYSGMFNGPASPRTELSKNTEETMNAYAGFRETGRVPIAFDKEGKPIYSFPKNDNSRFEGPIYSDINSVVDHSKEVVARLQKEAPDDFEVLLGNKPIPEGLVQLEGKKKGHPVKTQKDFLYNYFAPKYIKAADEKTMNTTSSALITKLVREMHNTGEEAFRGRVRSAFEIGGGSSQYNKAYNYQVLNDILGRPEFQQTDPSGRNTPNVAKIVDWINERVTPEELNAEKERLGYGKIVPSVMREIIDTVWTAEGQEATIPRTFLFGPKVGAYMLNRMSTADPRNSKYNTMDVWESRFWRYMNNDVNDKQPGIAMGLPRRVYMRQARQFSEAWAEKTGTQTSVSAGQAARWYLMKDAAKRAGYGKAGENEMIPFWTIQAIEKYMENQLGQEQGGEMSETLAGVFEGNDLQELNEAREFEREERTAIKDEKSGKATKADVEGPWSKKATKAEIKAKVDSKQGKLFAEPKAKIPKVANPLKTTEEKILAPAGEEIVATPQQDATPEVLESITTTFHEEETTRDNKSRQKKKPNTKNSTSARDQGTSTTEIRSDSDEGDGAGAGITTETNSQVLDAVEPARRSIGTKSTSRETGTGGLTVAEDQPDISTVSPYETGEVLRRKAMGVPDWRPKRDAKGNRTGKPISARAVVQNVLARAGIVASEFKAETRPGVLGFYKWSLSLAKLAGFKGGSSLHLRSSELADIGIAIHEVAHYLDEKFNVSGMRERLAKSGVSSPQTPAGVLTSLDTVTQMLFRDLDYHTRQKGHQRPDKTVGLAEGWAEAVRLYVEADDVNMALPAAVKSTLDSIMASNPELRKIINDTRVDVQSYLSQSDAEKVSMALQDMGRPVISPTESYFARQDRLNWFKAVERRVNKQLANRLVAQERYEAELKRRMKERFGSDFDSAWAELTRKTGGNVSYLLLNSQNLLSRATDTAIEEKVRDPMDGSVIGSGFKGIFKDFTNRPQLDEFGRYMYAKTGLMRIELQADRDTQYIAGEVNPEIMKEYVDEVEKSSNAQLFAKAMQDVTDYFNSLLDLEVKYGLKTQGEVDAMKASHEIYMPFIRQFDDNKSGTGGKILGVKSSIRKLKTGSVMPVLDVYDAAIDRTNDVFSTVIRKIAEKQFIDQAELSGVAGSWVRRMTKEEADGLDNIVTISRDGEERYYQIDPDLKEALTQVGPGVSPLVAKVLAIAGTPTAIARKLMVNFNVPYFTPKNLARDLKTLEIRGLSDTTGFSSTGGLLSALALKKVASHSSDSDTMFNEQGGARGTKLRTSNTGQQKAKREQKRRLFAEGMERSNREVAIDLGKKALDFTEAINDRIELAPRRAAYHMTLFELAKTQGSGFTCDKAGKITGVVPQWAKNQAMFNAMESTTNFNRRGKIQPFIEPFLLFYNAAIQGTYGQFRTIDNAMKSPRHAKRLAANLAVSAGARLACLYMMSLIKDDEDDEMTLLDRYLEIADYVKETSDVVPVKTPWGTSWVLIPKEREWGIVSGAIDSMVTAVIKGESITDKALSTGKRAIEQRLPFTGGVVPVAAQTFFNYDLFRGREITSYWDLQKKPQYRYDQHTSTAAKAIGSFTGHIGIDPKKVDFLLRNTVGNLGPKLWGFGTNEDEDRKWSNVPLLGPFMTDNVPRQSTADFYLMREKAGQDFDEYVNNRALLTPSEVGIVLDNYQTVGVTEQVAKLIRESDLTQEQKNNYITGVARWALDREPMSVYPNPLVEYSELPPLVRKEVLDILKRAREPQHATEKAPKGSEKLIEMKKAKIRIRQKLVQPPKE